LRPFLWVGRISYSLYLTHVLAVVAIHELVVPKIRSTWPASVMIAVVTSLAIGVSVCLAWLFHTYVERRFLAPSTQQPNVRYAASTSASVVAPHVLPLSGSINPQASARSGAT
jgi:peptidoglycan/LPS O-acetylase OafA/YrhL